MSLSGSVWETPTWQLGDEYTSGEKWARLAPESIICVGTLLFLQSSVPDTILATYPFSSKGWERHGIRLFLCHSCGSLNISCRRRTHTFLSLCMRMNVQVRKSHSTPSPTIMDLLVDTACQAFLSHCQDTLSQFERLCEPFWCLEVERSYCQEGLLCQQDSYITKSNCTHFFFKKEMSASHAGHRSQSIAGKKGFWWNNVSCLLPSAYSLIQVLSCCEDSGSRILLLDSWGNIIILVQLQPDSVWGPFPLL